MPAEFHDYDADGRDMFPEHVQFGYEALNRGGVIFTNFDETQAKKERVAVSTPEEAAHYSLRARGLRPTDPISIDLSLKTALASAIEQRQAKARRRQQAFLELLMRAA